MPFSVVAAGVRNAAGGRDMAKSGVSAGRTLAAVASDVVAAGVRGAARRRDISESSLSAGRTLAAVASDAARGRQDRRMKVKLGNGLCTGALLFKSACGDYKLQVRKGPRGRGLFAARSFARGEDIATIAGYMETAAVSGRECWQWSHSEVFVMHPSCPEHLGILANTAAGKARNNARYVQSPTDGAPMLKLRATVRIAAGAEILASYGRGYANAINRSVLRQMEHWAASAEQLEQVAPVTFRRGAVKVMSCAKCGRRVTSAIRLSHAKMCKH